MSTIITTPKPPPTKPRKDREREKERKDKPPQPFERLKTVVRRLPPNLPEDVFWQSVQTWVSDETVSWKIFYEGKLRKRVNKENIPSRAYIAFKNEEQLSIFSREYDGHVFRDKAGNESQAVVEFAPYQKVPMEKKKTDARNATIEKDEDYISFLESLASSANAEPVSLETLIAATQLPPPPKTTPLLEALKAEKSAHKDKESILRNHAHYKDQINLGPPGSRKDDTKKKGLPGQKATESAAGGKKSAKKAPAAVPSTSAQKPLSGVVGGGVSKNPGPSNAAPKPPKTSRQARQPPQAKVSAAPVVAGPGPTAPLIIDGSPPSASGVPSPLTPSGPAARRTRPMMGLASRQFEAALSGAGVGGAGERKSRREREKEREKEKEKEVGGAGASGGNVKEVPPSPRKDRGARRKDAGGGGGGGEPSVKIPSILQRSDGPPPAILQRETQRPPINGAEAGDGGVSNPVVPPVMASDTGTIGHTGGRGGRRGRGRGRGMAPGAARLG